MVTIRKYGIIGGLGPFASNRFLNSVYADLQPTKEQDLPIIHLVSDPSVPDRSEAISSLQKSKKVSEALISSFELLDKAGCDTIVLLCFTAHGLAGKSLDQFHKFTNLVDFSLTEFEKSNYSDVVMLCTQGSRESQVFEKSPIWPAVQRRVHFLSEVDQKRLHELIYDLKRRPNPDEFLLRSKKFLMNYPTAFFFGCTDLHILSNRRASENWELREVFDPLKLLAQRIGRNEL